MKTPKQVIAAMAIIFAVSVALPVVAQRRRRKRRRRGKGEKKRKAPKPSPQRLRRKKSPVISVCWTPRNYYDRRHQRRQAGDVRF